MAKRGRRHRSRFRSIRRVLSSRTFSVVEALLGGVLVVAGLWLIWPEGDDGRADQRARWAQSIDVDRGSPASLPDVRAGIAVAVADASLAVSARTMPEVRAVTRSAVSLADRRLARIAETMPDIGPEIASVPNIPSAQTEAVFRMPDPAPPPLPVTGPPADDLADRLTRPEVALVVPPRVRPDEMGGHAWLRNAAVPPVATGRPKIAIVIDDLGNNRLNTRAFNRLPGPLTLAFLPYAGDLEGQTAAARAAGHELMIHMPMEPVTDDWPGPDALLLSLSKEEFRERLRKAFDRFDGFVGINNHMGSRVTADAESMAMVMAELRSRDLLFLDSKTTPVSVGVREARRHGVPYTQRDVFLDNVPEVNAVLRQLRATEQVARRRGYAIAIGHPNDATIRALRGWLREVTGRGFTIVPVSTIVALRTCQREPLLAGCQPFVGAIRAEAGGELAGEAPAGG